MKDTLLKKQNMFKKSSVSTNKLENLKKEPSTNRFNKGKSDFSKPTIKEITLGDNNAFKSYSIKRPATTLPAPTPPKKFEVVEHDFPVLGTKPTKQINTPWNAVKELKILPDKPVYVEKVEKVEENPLPKEVKHHYIITKKKPLIMKNDPVVKDDNSCDETFEDYLNSLQDQTNEDNYYDWELSNYLEERALKQQELDEDDAYESHDDDNDEYNNPSMETIIYSWEIDKYIEERDLEKHWELMDGEDTFSDNDEEESIASDLEY